MGTFESVQSVLSKTKFLWCDLETTGLDPKHDLILEVGFIVTDAQLTILDSFSRVVGRSPVDLVRMAPAARDMHTKNGLAKACTDAFEKEGFNEGLVERAAVQFIEKHFFPDPLPGQLVQLEKPMLFGNSIHFDRGFIRAHMAQVESLLHYRMVDVSSFKILAKEWYDVVFPKPDFGNASHRVAADLTASIAELMFYREEVFGGSFFE